MSGGAKGRPVLIHVCADMTDRGVRERAKDIQRPLEDAGIEVVFFVAPEYDLELHVELQAGTQKSFMAITEAEEIAAFVEQHGKIQQ